MGYERPMYVVRESHRQEESSADSDGEEDADGDSPVGIAGLLAKKDPGSLTVARSDTFYMPPWFQIVEEEFTASRERCSLSDFTSFAKVSLNRVTNDSLASELTESWDHRTYKIGRVNLLKFVSHYIEINGNNIFIIIYKDWHIWYFIFFFLLFGSN